MNVDYSIKLCEQTIMNVDFVLNILDYDARIIIHNIAIIPKALLKIFPSSVKALNSRLLL